MKKFAERDIFPSSLVISKNGVGIPGTVRKYVIMTESIDD
jgi:hypothetical protein